MDLLWYKLPNGTEPARRFLAHLRNPVGRKAFLRRLIQLEAGSLGDHRHLGDELWEFRLHAGPGYRLYAGRVRHDKFLLLRAGIKGTQRHDIAMARRSWQDFRE